MCEIDRAAIPQMCGSNLQPELVQKALPLKGLMQCQNLWHQGQPLFLPHQSYKSWISFPHYSFLFFLLLNSSAREEWDVNETFSLEGRRILGQRWGPSQWHPHRLFSFFFLLLTLSPAVTPCGMWQADGNQHCVRAVISPERHKTCRNINKQQAAWQLSLAAMPASGEEGKVRTLGGCCGVEVSSSGFTATQEKTR